MKKRLVSLALAAVVTGRSTNARVLFALAPQEARPDPVRRRRPARALQRRPPRRHLFLQSCEDEHDDRILDAVPGSEGARVAGGVRYAPEACH